MTCLQVAEALLAYGIELEREGAAQTGGSFAGQANADELIESSANAFLIGVLFTQGIPAERAWSAPYRLLERLGTLDPEYLAEHEAEVAEAVQRPPMLHRFKNTLPRWISSAGRKLAVEYGGDAARIWPDGSHVLEVTERLSAFPGIGRKKAVMATEILVRHFGVALRGREYGQVAYDVQVRRVFLRSGLADEDTVAAIEAAATAASPQAPGRLDLAAWLIGRTWCRPNRPLCDACRLGQVCPRRVAHHAVGVGTRPANRSLVRSPHDKP